jgi:hypothetical protein
MTDDLKERLQDFGQALDDGCNGRGRDLVRSARDRIAALESWQCGALESRDIQNATIAALETQLAEARKLVRGAYSEGFSEGMREHTTSRGGKIWQESSACAALSKDSAS